MRNKWTLLFIILLASVALMGCYTVLKHPRAVGEVGMSTSFSDPSACGKCHVNDGFFAYQYDMYYSNYDPWIDYYARPWWWDAYWGDDWYYGDDGAWHVDGTRSASGDRGFWGNSGGSALVPSHETSATTSASDNRTDRSGTERMTKTDGSDDANEAAATPSSSYKPNPPASQSGSSPSDKVDRPDKPNKSTDRAVKKEPETRQPQQPVSSKKDDDADRTKSTNPSEISSDSDASSGN